MVTEYKREFNEKKEQRKGGVETTRQRVRRHLTDIRSKITDEDIRNVRIELEEESNFVYDDFRPPWSNLSKT
jgi:hypothetical protein